MISMHLLIHQARDILGDLHANATLERTKGGETMLGKTRHESPLALKR